MAILPLEQWGLRIWHGQVSSMAEPHRHNDIEINYVTQGKITYLFGGRERELLPGQWFLFWAALPHRLTQSNPNTIMTWLTVPLATWLRFDLPETINHPILQGKPILEPNSNTHTQLRDWLEDQQQPSPERQRIFLLELEAKLRRIALALQNPKAQSPFSEHNNELSASKAAQLAEYIAIHYLEPIQMQDIAKHVGLNTNYASSLFRHTFSMTMLEYLTQHRIAHAQRLLVTSHLSVLEVALESGFNSPSRFYTAFFQLCQCSPLHYRKQVQF